MNLQESIRRIIKEVRVPRSERVELYKDDNIIVVVPLTHRALQKYAHRCQWCINSDIGEWEDYHKGKHAVIIQRNPKKPKIGITGNPTASEIFLLAKWDNNQLSFEDVCQMLDYEFRNDRTMSDYYVTISNNINNFATNIVYYSPETGVYDQEDNFLWNFNIEINDIPNVKPKVIEIMDDYLQENEEMNLQENILRIKEVMGILNEQQKDPVTALTGLEGDIDSLLNYYVKGENGKFYDKKDVEQKTPVELGPTGAFFKAKVESVMYGAKQQNKYTTQLEQIRERIKNGKFKEYFGEWDNIRVQPQKFDYYTGMKCTSPNKNPGCGPTV